MEQDACLGLTGYLPSPMLHWVGCLYSSEYLKPPVPRVTFKHLCRAYYIMTDYGDHIQPSRPSRGPSLVQPAADAIRRSLARNSHYSHNSPSINATTRSWVHSQQNTPVPPPSLPLPAPLPTPVQRLRPLPNPHARHHRPSVLYTVNPSEPLDSEEDQQRTDNIRFAYQNAGPSKLRKPPASIHNSVHNIKDKKRTVLGGLVKSIRRIPKIIGYGAGKGATSNRRGTLGTDGEGTSTSVTGLASGSTLPQYTSNPPTPVVAPIPSRPLHYAHQPMGMQIPMSVPVLGSSPPPEVVRLDDVRRHRPAFRIMPPSINIARSQSAHFFPGTTNNTDSSSSAGNTVDRTTVMLYNYDRHTPTPTPPLSRQISSNGPPGRLSYIGSEQVVRPTSFHGGSQAPPPIEIPTSTTTRMGTPASYLSYVSQPTTLPPPHVNRSSSQPRSQPSNQSSQHHHQQHQPTSPPQHQPSSTPPIIEPSARIQSPVSAHPQPTTDYLKMALSPPQHHTTALTNLTSASHHTSSGITSFSCDPSFSKTSSSPIERFFKTLYYMPWIAYERITVDYFPRKVGRVHGHTLSRETSAKGVKDERKGGDGDRRKRETKGGHRDKWGRKQRRTRAGRRDGDEKIASWYKGVSSFRTKRTSAELDLLSSDLGSHSSPTTTTGIGATIGLGLENLPDDAASPRSSPPVAAVTAPLKERNRRQRERERKENVRDKQERTSHSRPHHHHHRQDPHNRHRGRQRRRIGDSTNDDEDKNLNRSPSPLIPMVYPYHYPPYPYPYPYAFTMPSPSGPHESQFHSHSHPLPPPSETPNDQTQSRNQRGKRNRANQGHPSPPSHPVFYSPGIPHPGYTAPEHAYQPMIAPPTPTTMAPQVFLLHSNSHGELQPLSPFGPVRNGSEVIGGGGPEVLVDAVDSGGQQ